MPELDDVARPPRKLLAGAAMKIRIALASGLVLALGIWLAPRAAQTTLSVPQERVAPLLEEQVQLREANRTFVGVQDVADRVRHHSVAIPAPAPTGRGSANDFSEPAVAVPEVAGFGVFVTETYVLAHSTALDGRVSVPLFAGAGRTLDARVVAYELATGLVLLETASSGQPPGLATEAPAAGALAIGVGQSEARDVAIPLFVTGVGAGEYTIGAGGESVLPGMPVFTLAGELFAIAAPDRREVRAIPAREAADRLIARVSAGERRASVGLGFQAPNGLLAEAFGEQGVIVTEVLEGGPADLAGVQVGDMLLAVGDAEIASVEEAIRVLGSIDVGSPAPLRLRRAGRTSDVTVTPALAYDVAGLARARADDPAGLEARVLLPPPVLDRAAIPPTAQVLSMNGRAVTSRAQALRELRRVRAPVPILLRHRDDRYFVAVEPAP